jgi:peptide/histidine transporter 3/4
MTFVTCGVLLSVGDTFFLYQAYNLDVRHFILLLIFQKIVEKMLSTITKKFTKKGSSKYAAPIGMIIAMLFSMACLMIAAKVEKMGLHSEKTLEMFWLLLPQFILLGAFEGISYSISGDMSTACFFNDKEVSNSIIRCLDIFSDCAFGIGILGGTAPVDIVKKYRSRNLQDTPNDIRLDYYYWTLAVVSSINLVFSILVTIWYYYQYSAIEDNRTPETDQLPTVDNAVVAVA